MITTIFTSLKISLLYKVNVHAHTHTHAHSICISKHKSTISKRDIKKIGNNTVDKNQE